MILTTTASPPPPSPLDYETLTRFSSLHTIIVFYAYLVTGDLSAELLDLPLTLEQRRFRRPPRARLRLETFVQSPGFC